MAQILGRKIDYLIAVCILSLNMPCLFSNDPTILQFYFLSYLIWIFAEALLLSTGALRPASGHGVL
jgi:hypothetical protein